MPFSECEDLSYETYNTESNCETARSQQQQTAIKYIWFTGKSPTYSITRSTMLCEWCKYI